MCSKYDYCSMLDGQHNWVCVCWGGGLYDHLMSMSVTCLMDRVFIYEFGKVVAWRLDLL